MMLDLTPEEIAFRAEVREFLTASLTEDMRRAQRLATVVQVDWNVAKQWQQALHRRGWGAPSWPTEYGGTGWTLRQRFLFDKECALAEAPAVAGMGLELVGPVLMRYGTAEQRARFLAPIISGEHYWCQGYSEPGAGSDLASLRTRAERRGESYVVNGSKIWTTHAHFANWIFCLVRTSNEGRKQEGISFLLIDLNTPGITIRPLTLLGGDHDFNEVFFDDVAVPVANRVGAENRGWDVAKYLLENERGGQFGSGRARAIFRRLLALARTAQVNGHAAIDDQAIAMRLARIAADLDTLEMLELSVMDHQAAPNPTAPSMLKIRTFDIRQEITELSMQLLGSDALRRASTQPLHLLPQAELAAFAWPDITPRYFNDRAGSIYGGTTEVQLNIIAKLGLRL